jgi:hypothetical protein
MLMKSKISVRTVVLVILAIFATSFAFNNRLRVQVWPFGGAYPITVVIGISFALGVGVGAVGQSILGLFRTRSAAPLDPVPVVSTRGNEHPGRP